ncbi:MAG: hypothetical protein RIM23_28480 [Coleofasciculus sp. G3-WIS-01]
MARLDAMARLPWRVLSVSKCRGGFHYYRFLPHPDATKPAPLN